MTLDRRRRYRGPFASGIPIVGDLRATFEPIAKQRSCIPVEHSRGVVEFDKERLSLKLPAREPRPPLAAPCADEAGIVVAAQRFADLLGQRSRDTVRALPQPFAHPSVVTAPQAQVAINAMSTLSSWTDNVAVHRPLAAQRNHMDEGIAVTLHTTTG